MEILLSISAKIAEYTVEPIVHQLGYLYYYNNNISDLVKEVEMLKVTQESVQYSVDEAERNVEVIEDVVKNWLGKADGIINSCEMLIHGNESQENKKCCSSGLCFNLVQRHQVSWKAKQMTVEVLEIKTNGKFERISHKVPLSKVMLEVSGFMSFGSRESIIRQIMDSLKNDNVNMIAVYGMGGVGKTMLAKEIIRRIKENESFHEAVMSTVSQTQDFKRIQGELGDMLGLKFEEETIQGRATKLHMRLIEKKILIVLDDIWEDIDLDAIGIPSVAHHKGCKILYTSRDKNTLSGMYVDKTFEVKVLEQEESWNLFKKMAGEIVEQSDLKPTAVEIVKECAHLPIALATIAKALKSKPFPIWRDALKQLQNPKVMNIKGMNDKVYTSLELSYAHLNSEAKLVFLLCSMFPEDHLINVEDLHVYAMGMGLLMDINTLAQGRDRTIKLVDDLISSSLLQDFRKYQNVYAKMHDMVRDVAIVISSKDDRIRTLSYVQGLNKWQEEKIVGNCNAAYLHFGNLPNSQQKLMLPSIQLLMLTGACFYNNYELSGTFFEEMKELKVLELVCMRISLSPPSLHCFANLQSLRLLNCVLKDIDMSSVEFNKLEILSFRGSNITEIPMVISKSIHLKVLDLSFCNELKVIPPDLLSNLTKLEELFLGSFRGWEEENLNRERRNASLCELKHLSRLSALSICIPNEKIMPRQLISSELNLEKFDISIGSNDEYFYPNNFRRLILHMESESPLHDWIKILLKSVEELYLGEQMVEKFNHFELELDENETSHMKNLHLENMTEVKHFIYESKKAFWKIFTKMKRIQIQKCKMLEGVIVMESGETSNKIELTHLNSLSLYRLPRLLSFCSKIEQLDNSEQNGTSKMSNDGSLFNNQISLPNLETLQIEWVDNLKGICEKKLIPDSSFAILRKLEIISCDNLEKVFPSNMMSILKCLEHLRITNCKSLEGIFEVEEPNTTDQCDDLLPRLKLFELINLSNLEYVWSKNPDELQILGKLQLCIEKCPKLKRVYPVNILKQLIFLEIEYDELIETLEKAKSVKRIEMDGTQSPQGEIIELWDGSELLPKLQNLNLSGSLVNNKGTHLPLEIVQTLFNLKTLEVKGLFVEEIFLNCPNVKSDRLESLTLSKLPKLKHIWKESSQMNTLMLQNLDDLRVEECGKLNSLVPSSGSSLKNLTRLTIQKCHGLTHLINPQVATTLVKLQYMELGRCRMMTSVIAPGSTDEEEIVFTKLTSLILDDLPRLASFHSGRCIIRFPCLDFVNIKNCPEMKVFSLGTVTTPCLKKKRLSYFEHAYLEDIVEDINIIVRENWDNIYDIQHWYTGQVLLPYHLEILIFVFAYGFWKMICPNEILGVSLAKLSRVEIAFCNNLEKVFPSNVMSTLECLTSIKIKSCHLLQGIFEDQDSDMARDEKYGAGLLPQLISLKLIDLPNLKYVWREDPQELQIFENMQNLCIHQCPKFKRVYPQQLKSLKTEYGELMEALKSVRMAELGSCENSKIEIIELWNGPELLPKLEDLTLSGSFLNCKQTHFPKEIVRILHSLENLEVRELFVEEIFPNCPIAKSHPLRSLILNKLPKLKHLWKENSQMNTLMLSNLERLKIEECGRFNSIVPSSMSSLRNLSHLIIHKCHGLTHLLIPHMATTLAQLQRMKLSECKMMTSVISQGSTDEEEIVFTKLERLELEDLPRLASFHSGSCIIRFPSLDDVKIKNCPEMKVFSMGETSTPYLTKAGYFWWSDLEKEYLIAKVSKFIRFEDIDVIIRQAWENIFDSSIQHLFTEHALLPNLDYTPQCHSGFKLMLTLG